MTVKRIELEILLYNKNITIDMLYNCFAYFQIQLCPVCKQAILGTSRVSWQFLPFTIHCA